MQGFSPRTLKFFVRHIADASRRQQQREEKISGFESQITMLKKTASAPKPNREKLTLGLDELDKRIKEVIHQERVLVLNQQKETAVIEELKERLGLLEERMLGMGHVHSITEHHHIKKIKDLSRAVREEGKKKVVIEGRTKRD